MDFLATALSSFSWEYPALQKKTIFIENLSKNLAKIAAIESSRIVLIV